MKTKNQKTVLMSGVKVIAAGLFLMSFSLFTACGDDVEEADVDTDNILVTEDTIVDIDDTIDTLVNDVDTVEYEDVEEVEIEPSETEEL